MQANNDNPVLNNPYEEPRYYYDTDMNGNIDYQNIINGRRPFGYDVHIVPKKREDRTLFSQGDFVSADPNAEFINIIRSEVKAWREAGYPKASRITKELLDFWFNNKERKANLSLFFCQREAVETAVWLNEIAKRDPNTGNYILNLLGERRHSVSEDDAFVLPRTAFKMATGTGKTVVMAMLILYNYLNKRANPMDTHYADHFLLCAPGITIRDRLGVLQLDFSKRSNDYERTDYYHQRNLIPRHFEKELGGLNSSITIVNYQQFLPRTFSGKHASPLDGKQKWKDGELVTQKDKEDYSVMLSRILERGVKGKRIVVINDEAHHCYLPRQDKNKALSEDEKNDLKQENETAMVWYEGLRQMKLLGYKLQHVYDLSATPYYLKGSGYPEYSLFPWVVSDFGLVDAIESGLVKIPYLPAYDNTPDLDEPKLRNIYECIKDKLPKRGMKAQKKKDKEDQAAGVESVAVLSQQAPNLPTLLNTALDQFVEDYRNYDRGLREAYEAMGTLYTAPPVMIVVCNNTTVSYEVYREIAGYQDGVNEDGEPRYRQGRFNIFSNYDAMGLPKNKFPTLLIDSSALDEASTRIDEAFKKAYAEEIEDFKHEYANQHGAGSADNLTDADILREVVNTVGKPGKLGGDIKCVVSVSMLTEGWDANTVTHVCGIRAFGSQLLCEQVVGRALRRQSYELTAYDKLGREIDPKDIYKYNKENVTYKFPPEYARIIGVPFNTFKGGQTVVTKPQKPKAIVRALPERQATMEIRFPVITGYRSDNIEGTLTAKFEGLPKFVLDFNKVPTKTALQSVVNDKEYLLKTDYMELRDSQVVYYFAHLMIREYYTSREHGQQFQKFPDIKHIVETWYNTQLEIRGDDGSPEQKRLVMLWDYKAVLANIMEGVHQANANQETISAVLNYYNPEGSTVHVFRPTNRTVWPTQKSHINCIVCEDNSWQQIAAQTLDRMDCVVAWVRNQYLGLRIPYTVGDENKEYQPTFIVRTKDVNLIVECEDFDGDKSGNKEAKRHYLKDYWLPAANNLKSYGRWDLLEVRDIDQLGNLINEKIKQL
ncbi:MAG: DEAD/DEAH box helicase family protein [Bacteroidaceae bacterium]|nr:DEAD/DEAH box helicase family protein [Bacteroidaceae bacterium]